MDFPNDFKRLKRYHEPGDFHELTFTCYHRKRLLTNDMWPCWLARSIDESAAERRFELIAFVFMPEHVHLLIRPTNDATALKDLAWFLAALKRTTSSQVQQHLAQAGASLLKTLTIQTRPGVKSFRFWQEGAGYDRNLQNERSITASIDYLHQNPIRRKRVDSDAKWKWSSARWYASDRQVVDPDLPRLSSPPATLFLSRQ